MLVIVHMYRPLGNEIRIVNARMATTSERAQYGSFL